MDRRQKEREFFAHHAETFKKLNLPNPIFILKTAFYEKGRFGRNIQLYESELKKNEDLYIEFIDVVRDENGNEQNYTPMLEDRPLFKFRANPFYAEEYEQREKAKYSVYIISASELMVILPDGSEISYSLYEKRKEEAKRQAESLPKLQTTLSVFPDFEEEFAPKKEIDLSQNYEDAPLSEMTLRDLAAIMLMKPVSNREWLNNLVKQAKSEI